MAQFYAQRSLAFYILIGFIAFLFQVALFAMDLPETLPKLKFVALGLMPIALTGFTGFFLARKLYFTDVFFERPLSATIAIVSLVFSLIIGLTIMGGI